MFRGRESSTILYKDKTTSWTRCFNWSCPPIPSSSMILSLLSLPSLPLSPGKSPTPMILNIPNLKVQSKKTKIKSSSSFAIVSTRILRQQGEIKKILQKMSLQLLLLIWEIARSMGRILIPRYKNWKTL